MLVVRPEWGQRDLRKFIELPYRLHSSSGVWVPPLRLERRLFLSRRQNAYFTHGDAQLFLARRGEGIHHVGYAVPSVSDALDQLGAEGVQLVDEAPRIGSGGTTIGFVHPKGTGGVLVELVEEGTGHRG